MKNNNNKMKKTRRKKTDRQYPIEPMNIVTKDNMCKIKEKL